MGILEAEVDRCDNGKGKTKPQHLSKPIDYNRELEAISKFSHRKVPSSIRIYIGVETPSARP
jgi:hypothetical protein